MPYRDALFWFAAKEQSLKKIPGTLIGEITGIQTTGALPKHTLPPESVEKLPAVKQEIPKFLKE
jgi:hypothetical protein